MAWEERNGTRYYYRKRRIGRHVVSEYVGIGSIAEYEAKYDQHQAEERRRSRERKKAEAKQAAQLDRALNELAATAKTIVNSYLQACGYHKHKGQWRKARDGRRDTIS